MDIHEAGKVVLKMRELANPDAAAEARRFCGTGAKPAMYRAALTMEIGGPGFLRKYEAGMAELDAAHALKVKRAAALRRFRRAMRRHEKRARAMGGPWLADLLWSASRGCNNSARCAASAELLSTWANKDRNEAASRRGPSRDRWRRSAFLFSLAADAVARLRADLGAT